MTRSRYTLALPDGARLEIGDRTVVMGIVNVTPDSFSDGGRCLEPARAIDHALSMEADGADILDIGGESTRPGARALPVAEELARRGPEARVAVLPQGPLTIPYLEGSLDAPAAV